MKKQITIRQFQRLNEIESIKGLEDGIEKRILMASAVTGVSVGKLKQMDLVELPRFVNSAMDDYDFDFKEETHKSSIMVSDKKYYIVAEVQNIISAQLMDLSLYAKEEKDIINNLHFIVAILLREDKKTYNGVTLSDRAAIMREHCPYNEIYQIAVFFCKLLSRLPNLLEMEKKASLRAMLKIGVGSST